MRNSHHYHLLPALNNTVTKLKDDFTKIPEQRKQLLVTLATYISDSNKRRERIKLNFICTQNSRRSHIAQLWAQAAAHHYDIPDVYTYSGGTEATAFNPRAVKAMREAGFEIRQISEGENPTYEVTFSKEASPIKAFSKKYDDPSNPRQDFAAIMTCAHADESCPYVHGATKRFAITYDDPKEFDGTQLEQDKYGERVLQIGREMLYMFSLVGKN